MEERKEMTRDEFWTIVESVDWATLSLTTKPYEAGKQILLAALPTQEIMNEFREHFDVVGQALHKSITDWESYNDERIPCSDDGFSDLTAHIIGLGRDEFAINIDKPSLINERAGEYDYVESFAYCIPYESDYDPTDIKLARAVDGLTHWLHKYVDGDMQGCVANEVRWRGKMVESLRERLKAEGGTELTPEAYEAKMAAERLAEKAAFEAAMARRDAKDDAKAKLLADFEAEWS